MLLLNLQRLFKIWTFQCLIGNIWSFHIDLKIRRSQLGVFCLLFCWFQCSSHSAGTAQFHWGLEFTKRRVPKCATESKGVTGLQQPTVRILKSLCFGEDFHLHKNRSVIKKKSILFWEKNNNQSHARRDNCLSYVS